MIFLKHNFYSNFTDSIKAGDSEMISDIVINELSNLVVYHKDKLILLFGKVKIPIKANATNQIIAEKLVANLPKNIMLTKGLAFLIGETNDSVVAKKKNNESEKKASNSKTSDKNPPRRILPTQELSLDWKENIRQIDAGIEKIATDLKEKPQTQILFKDKLINSINIKLESLGRDNEKIAHKESDNTFLILLSLIAVGVAIYFLSKQKTIETITETVSETVAE